MRTIFVTCFQAVEVKNLLRTGVSAALLSESGTRIIALVRNAERAEYYARELPIDGVTYAICDPKPQGLFESVMSFLKFHLIRTRTTDMRRLGHYRESSNFFTYCAGLVLTALLARRLVRRALRRLDGFLVGDSGLATLFETYRPDIVVLANLFDDAEVGLLRDARCRGVGTVGFINTWDKPTARCSLRLLPDWLLVYNEIIRDEAERLADMPRGRIRVVGVPQYDIYASAPAPRDAFMRSIGCDPRKRLVLFAPMGSAFSRYDWHAIDLLHDIFEREGRIPDVQLFVRFQPNDFVDVEELRRRPWLRYDLPGLRFGSERGGDWDMTEEDAERLRDTLAHAGVVVSYASSIGIDSALMGTPVININFEIGEGTTRREPGLRSPTFYYGTEHYQKALASGGIRLVGSTEEFVEWTRRYLENPALDRDGRERLVREQCVFTDGKSGARIARTIRELASLHAPIRAV